jgi:glycerophosphoryl diester phosphodiesterase
MPLPHLAIVPDANSYSSDDGTEVLATSMDSGAGRYRRDKRGAVKKVNVQWTMGREAFTYWRAFWNTSVRRGTLPFTCDLLSEDGGGPVSHKCSFVPGSVSMPSQEGLTFVQTAALEVIPLPVDDDFNEEVIAIFEAGLDESFFDALDHLVTVAMPETLGA